jgi:hypothetical protein
MDHMKSPIVVRNATAGDVASVQAVDVAACEPFREIDDPRIARAADDPPYWVEGLTRAATEQRGEWRSTCVRASAGHQRAGARRFLSLKLA